METQLVLPQPNFGLVAQAYNTVSEELGKCANLPTVQNDGRMLQEMGRLTNALTELTATMNRRFDRLEARMDRLELRVRASDSNNLARLVNSQIKLADSSLTPLRSFFTNDSIERFPATPRAIRTMNSESLVAVLRDLDADTSGNVEAKRMRLRLLIGMSAEPA